MDDTLHARIRGLFVATLAVSVIALAIAAFVGGGWPVWVRGAAVAAVCLWLIVLAGQAYRGSRAAYVRVRWISTLMPFGIVLLIVAPNSGFPVWMKIEQGIVGVLLAVVAVLVNSRRVRETFPKPSKP